MHISKSLDGFAIAIVRPLAIAIDIKAALIQLLSGKPKDTLDRPTIVPQPNSLLHHSISFKVSNYGYIHISTSRVTQITALPDAFLY